MRGLVLLLVLALPAGCLGATEEAEPDRLSREAALPPRGYHELDLRLQEGDAFTLSFQATGELTWDAHTHDGGEVKVVASGRGADGGGVVTASTAGVYSVFFQNPGGAPVNLTYEVAGRFEPLFRG